MKNQKLFTEDVLFNNYMISSPYENYIHSQIPFFIDTNCYEKMVYYSESINKISTRVLNELNTNHKKLLSYIDDFPFKEDIFNLTCPVAPMLWTRFDTFRTTKGEIYFAEFNYDKPCAQKEISLAGSFDFEKNINSDFKENFITSLVSICNDLYDQSNISVGILIDPCHYDEFHLATYIKDILKDTNITIHQVGPKNLSVKNDNVYAFEEVKINVILKLFPAEYLYEIDNFGDILEAFNKGNVTILNDPRVVAIQAKTFFAYLWELTLSNSPLLSSSEKKDIKACIPYTTIFNKDRFSRSDISKATPSKDINKISEVIKNKDKYVIKSSLGRYSGEVYIGKLYTAANWEAQVQLVLNSDKIHIIQDVIDIKQEYTYRPGNHNMNLPMLSYGNFGTYITKEKLIGICIRWSENFLTDDSNSWMCPLGVKNLPISIDSTYLKPRKETWDKIVERSLFEYNFTGPYTNVDEFLSTDRFLITENLYDEMNSASIKFCNILKKTNELIKCNFPMFSDLLSLPENLKEVILSSDTDALCALGRIDFVLDNNGDLKILEFNSETPAGIVESIGITNIIKEELKLNYTNPNDKLKDNIKNVFKKILKDIENNKNMVNINFDSNTVENIATESISTENTEIKTNKIKNIAFVSTNFYEDLFNTSVLHDILKEEGKYNLIIGNIYDLEIRDDKLYLYNTPIDAMYRYFPLDWISYDDDLCNIIPILNKGTSVINPTSTLIIQSKAYLAVIYELIGKGFYSDKEEAFIKKYIPYTCLVPNNNISTDFLVKPYLSREGGGITMSYEDMPEDISDVIFQERVNIAPLQIERHSTLGSKTVMQFPVMGIYITGDTPCGIFTRIGDFITDSSAIFLPTFITPGV
ncbi:glutathionylspermidine synthase family protein [Clostridium gasigenes]|uniref:glutathionylspermidine synthase family protein n=1 Tax=Clostridium gasigenes TaxID=94869 RepID=UPI001438287A|nr:glutathionylspermidine synthase family protein [Clostridium gasigenes]NKF07342.1 glutathionylspermidine synthase family protein [Clostridium gasigenes]QSW18315.1 glutathionylspermidine synthase family protein [Clostridium gasigenes]